MIHLDTNYLIGLLVKGSAPAVDVDGWLAAGESLAAFFFDRPKAAAVRLHLVRGEWSAGA